MYHNKIVLVYDIRLKTANLDTDVFPPALSVDLNVENNTKETLPVLLYFSIFLQSSEHNYTFWEVINPPPGRTSLTKRLAFDYIKFLKTKQMLGQSNDININIEGTIVSEGGGTISHHGISLTVGRDKWVLAQQENNKPKPEGIQSYHHFMAILDNRFSELQKKTADDPIFQLQQRIFQKQVDEVRSYLMEQPEMRILSSFQPLIDISNAMKIDPRWAIAAALLSSLEGYMKSWLIKNAGVDLKELKKLEFDELISKIEDTLNSKNIQFEQKKLSDLIGKRHLRNRVLHQMYVPKDSEIKEINEESIEFVNYIESLIPLKS